MNVYWFNCYVSSKSPFKDTSKLPAINGFSLMRLKYETCYVKPLNDWMGAFPVVMVSAVNWVAPEIKRPEEWSYKTRFLFGLL